MKPAAFSSYEHCIGESPVGTHVCPDREVCKRFVPAGYKLNYKNFWLADSCPKYEAKERVETNAEEPAKTEW